MITPVSFTVPRKGDQFQEDIFPDSRALEPHMAIHAVVRARAGACVRECVRARMRVRVRVIVWAAGVPVASATAAAYFEGADSGPLYAPHPHRDWAHRCHIRTGIGRLLPQLRRGRGSPLPHLVLGRRIVGPSAADRPPH